MTWIEPTVRVDYWGESHPNYPFPVLYDFSNTKVGVDSDLDRA